MALLEESGRDDVHAGGWKHVRAHGLGEMAVVTGRAKVCGKVGCPAMDRRGGTLAPSGDGYNVQVEIWIRTIPGTGVFAAETVHAR